MSGSVEARSSVATAVTGAVAGAVARCCASLGVQIRELACLTAIVAAAAAFRLVNLPVRGGWDSDQGTEMLALRAAVASGHLPTFGPEAISVGATFHHGALYYDLLLPATWLGNGDPTFVVAEIALLSLLVVPIVWWIARSIGGPAAGLTAALLAAVSASLIGYSTFIWNPTLVEPGAAIAFLGAWQAWRTHRPWWWLVAAAGSAVAAQAHVAAAVLALPMAVVYLADLRRGPVGRRRRILAWGLAGVTLVAITYLPVIYYELGHDFAETRGMLGYFAGPDSAPARDPLTRLLFSAIRILAWPLTRWPLVDLRPAFLPAVAVATSLAVALIWRVRATRAAAMAAAAEGAAEAGELAGVRRAAERDGLRFVGGLLLLVIVALGLGLHSVSEVQELPTEQYHVVADPLVLVAAGLVIAGLWRATTRGGSTAAGRVMAGLAILSLVVWNVGHWPPATAPDGGWPAAHAAARSIERDVQGGSIAIVAVPADKGSDAYGYPLTLDGMALTNPANASTVVVLCDSFWIETGCGDAAAEATWLSLASAGPGLQFVERFAAAPDRTLSVYRRSP
jgi:hypothetical protein